MNLSYNSIFCVEKLIKILTIYIILRHTIFELLNIEISFIIIHFAKYLVIYLYIHNIYLAHISKIILSHKLEYECT